MAKNVKTGGYALNECGVCGICKWLLPIIILIIALVPNWYDTTWGKWVIIITAALLLLKFWCPCQRK